MSTFRIDRLVFVLLLIASLAQAQPRIEIDFDTSALETIILHPEDIMDNPDDFWRQNPTYALIKAWHDAQRLDLKTEAWVERLKLYAETPIEQRNQNACLVLARQILAAQQPFRAYAVSHILSYLPPDTPNFQTTVFLVEETRTGGFSAGPRIVLDVTNHVNSDLNTLLNTVIHELYHSGYAQHRLYRTEYSLENPRLDRMLDLLQNEGLATYVGYKANDVYPVNLSKKDYRILGDKQQIRNLRTKMNDFFLQANALGDSAYWALEDDVAYDQRGYYSFGAFMAQTIDETLGRETLTMTVRQGPRSFVAQYNRLVDEEMRLHEFPLPDIISLSQHLRVAYLNNDTIAVEKHTQALLDSKGTLAAHIEPEFNMMGYGLLMMDRLDDALQVLHLNTQLFPLSGNTHDSYGEALALAGYTAKAIASYEQSLVLDPGNDNARSQLDRLKDTP